MSATITPKPVVHRDGTVTIGKNKIGTITRRVFKASQRTYRVVFTAWDVNGELVSEQYNRSLVVEALALRA